LCFHNSNVFGETLNYEKCHYPAPFSGRDLVQQRVQAMAGVLGVRAPRLAAWVCLVGYGRVPKSAPARTRGRWATFPTSEIPINFYS
jgi:hypothetical protein